MGPFLLRVFCYTTTVFSNPIQPSSQLDEGVVLAVDVNSSVCKVKTLTGQVLSSVAWMSTNLGPGRDGDRSVPCVGARVVLHYGLGTPIIMGSLPRIQAASGATPLVLFDGTPGPDTGNYSPGTAIKGDQNKPADMIQGDRVISSVGGSLFASMRAGTIVLRAARTAEIIASKLRGLVRIVSRNWEHFTDLSSDVIKNYKGSLYRYTGYAQTFDLAKVEDYRLNFYYGNCAAAETIKTGYDQYASINGIPIPVTEITYKEQITDGTLQKMFRTLDINGNQDVYITLDGTTYTRIQSTGNQIQISWKNQHKITINDSQINLIRSDGAQVNMNSSGIQAQMIDTHVVMTSDTIQATTGTPTVTMNSNSIVATTGTPSITMTANNIVATTGDPHISMTPNLISAGITDSTVELTATSLTAVVGVGSLTLDATESSLMYGSHGVIVSAAGVALV